ncbi:ABC transporter permease [Ramlibacter tataouinensis]|uniref:Candidate ABC type Fe3+ transport system, permease component with duplicated domains n=1 Tax=Ramlibacter tataouinensis (strain ATCC BAA-407 / DSM 14655 / LMG 21543 / TTB310) TaxID=365046 RepID=F5Y5I2_RAMTT|nr:iron ABC transporter permease [Ramlibacter tataouinensis]AEG92678.1 candidate ABC type Fe3+ transport system, permease component with duplicated domains [Ramlibacter tataouinensis TTB310]
MSVALPEREVAIGKPHFRFDLTRPAFYALAAVLAVLVVLPLAWLAYYALVDKDGQPTLANFAALVSDATLRKPYVLASGMALGVGLLSVVIATPLAWLVSRTDLPGRRAVRALVTASFVTPPFLGAIAWEILAAPNSGLINVFWRWAAGGQPYDAPLVNIYSFGGLVFAIACYTFPYVFTLVANGLDRVPADLEDASAILGGRAWTTLRKITFPLVLPAVLAGALIAILQALTMFGSPAILALPAGFHVITTKIWSLFQFPPKPGLAAAAALPLLLITVLLLQGKSWILGRKGYTVLGGKSGAPRISRLGPWMPVAALFAFAVLSLTVLLPYAALLKTALTKNGVEGLTLHNFHFVFFEFSATRLAMYNTFVLGFATATIGTGIALMAAYMVSRSPVRGAGALGLLATAPVAIPGIVLGVGLFLTYSHPSLMLYGTLWILLIAFLTIEMPAGYQQMQAAFHGIHPELEEASRILGASRMKTLRLITAPLLRTSVIATWCFVFIGTIRELSATILLTTANTKLVSVIIYDLNESGDMGAISVLGIMLLAVSFTVVFIANRLPLLGGQRLPALR